ncbi:MAG: acyltransferase, partial [Pseudomonadota bacterium]
MSSQLVSPGPDRIPQLDGLRGFAILMVLVWHCVAGFTTTEPGSFAAYLLVPFRLTWSGVDLFFVLSGYLIGGILLDTRQAPGYFQRFFLRRAFRILPVYYVVWCLFALGVWAHRANVISNDFLFEHSADLFWYPLFLQNWAIVAEKEFAINALSVSWSLCIEEQFYLLFPFLLRFMPSSGKLCLVLASLIVAALLLRASIVVFYP